MTIVPTVRDSAAILRGVRNKKISGRDLELLTCKGRCAVAASGAGRTVKCYLT
jgi:hypothetical protein